LSASARRAALSSCEKGLGRDVIFIMERRELPLQALERYPETAALVEEYCRIAKSAMTTSTTPVTAVNLPKLVTPLLCALRSAMPKRLDPRPLRSDDLGAMLSKAADTV
jgi:hypothetical protein